MKADSTSAGIAEPTAARVALCDAAHELNDRIRTAAAPAEVCERAAALVAEAAALLEPYRGEGPWCASILSDRRVEADLNDLPSVLRYSPVLGPSNPVAMDIDVWAEGDGVAGRAMFGPVYAGPPGCLHGGMVAAVFDELLAVANLVCGQGGFTGILTIRYHQPTPLGDEIRLSAENYRRDGRKIFTRGEMWAGDTLTASAEGVFIKPKEWK